MQIRYTILALLIAGVLVAVGVIFTSQTAIAQTDAGTCPALVEQALENLGNNCDSLDRNGACYGFNSVAATFYEAQPDDFFSTPADRAALAALSTIETVPLDTEQERWGIAVMNVQANIPNTLPGQSVVYLLLGDVEVENAIAPEDVLTLVDPITVTTLVGSNLRSRPLATSNLRGSVPASMALAADGISPDGNWLRVLFDSRPAWISRDLVDARDDLSALPTVGSESRTPMQAFNFRTGLGAPTCDDSPPSLLVVQGPDNLSVDITANGADITIGSTIALRLLPDNTVQLIVVSGSAEVGGITVPAGFTMTAELGPDGVTIIGDWGDFRPLTEEELQFLQPLQNLPSNIMNYDIIVPRPADIQVALQAFGAAQSTIGAGGQPVCEDIRATSPLGGLPYGDTTFYWDGSPNVTSYEVRVYNDSGQVVATYPADGSATSTQGSTDQAVVGNGFLFSWSVVALVDGQPVCETQPVTMFREAPEPIPEKPKGPVCGDYVCEGSESCYTCSIDCGC